jgi:hypothetical protein
LARTSQMNIATTRQRSARKQIATRVPMVRRQPCRTMSPSEPRSARVLQLVVTQVG